MGNPSAPATAIGVYAGDACNYFGDTFSCSQAPATLVDFTDLNTGGSGRVVDQSQVHLIMNGPEANSIYGTPWGTAPRSSLRDAWTNSANFQIGKNIKIGERVNINWHMSLVNAFNHANPIDVDPILEDAGDNGEFDGFGDPSLFDGGHRTVRFGLRGVVLEFNHFHGQPKGWPFLCPCIASPQLKAVRSPEHPRLDGTRSGSAGGSKAAFVRSYFASAPGGTDQGWSRLGPGEQAQGRASYDRFWRGISSVDVSSVRPVAGSDAVDVTLTYHSTNGRASTERKRFDLIRSGSGSYLINGERPIG